MRAYRPGETAVAAPSRQHLRAASSRSTDRPVQDRDGPHGYARAVRALLLTTALLAACGGSPPPADPARRPEHDRDREPAPAAPRSDRDLAAGATFADLATAARRQDERRDSDAEAACLVRASGDRYRLEADLAVAVRPLPVPPDDLDARMQRERGPVRVLARFGAYGGDPAADTALVAINTTLPPARGIALAIVLTDRGAYARRSDQAGGEGDASRVDWVIERAPWSEVDLVAVTAEAGVPVRAVVELMERIPATMAGRVTLAVVLEEGTRLPDAPVIQGGERAELCPGGLPELAEDAPLGDLAPERIRGALDPLRSAAELCVGTSTGPGAAGGRVSLAVRIGPDGRVTDACAMEDSTGDAELRACLARAARGLAFDPPGGVLDFALPLVLEPGTAQRQVPVCR